MKYIITSLLIVIALSQGCVFDSEQEKPIPPIDFSELNLTAEVKKWSGDRPAAVSITYDALWPSDPLVLQAADDAINRGLTLSYEMNTSLFVNNPEHIVRMQDELLPKGITFYGHGHEHINYDEVEYLRCIELFSLCFDYMKEWGLNPKAYAYPHGKGFKTATRWACMTAGFICARGLTFSSNQNYICQYDETEPHAWFYLPTISVAQDLEGYVQNNGDMANVVNNCLQKSAWIIIMYHSLGFPEGWGYYPYEDYLKDLDLFAENDFWCASMEDITCYVKERNTFSLEIKEEGSTALYIDYSITFSDGLENETYDVPLTIDMIIDSDTSFTSAEIIDSDVILSTYTVTDNRLRINAVPDEKQTILRLRLELKE